MNKPDLLNTGVGQVFNGKLYQCSDCNSFFAIPGDIDPAACPVCGCCEDIREDREECLIIADGSIFADLKSGK